MATYVIGDVHGCFDALLRLLEKINFRPSLDTLYFTGDLVNRGPQSLEVLRWLNKQDERVHSVLGNHDLHLIGRALGVYAPRRGDTLSEVLTANDCASLVDRLRGRPLAVAAPDFLLVHAGVYHAWSLADVSTCAMQLSDELRASDSSCKALLADVFVPQDALSAAGQDGSTMSLSAELRILTQLRFCKISGNPDYRSSAPPDEALPQTLPWFCVRSRKISTLPIYFGHWASLGFYKRKNVTCIDTGCAWGHELSAYCIASQQRFCVPAESSVPR